MAKHQTTRPRPGWWAVEHNVGGDRRLSTLPPDMVLPCLGLMIGATGWAISFETEIVTDADLTRHSIVGAASTSSILEAVKCLVEAGIWTYIEGVGYDCGARQHIEAKVDRIEKARNAVEAREVKRAQNAPQPSTEKQAMDEETSI